jgi:aspartate carbamoyltransferase catalytic subunit
MLGIESLSADEILFLLDQSKPFQEIQRHPLKKLATLRGKTVALAFFEPSTRTRISFATAAARLGADQMNLQAESSSLKKGESLLDTVRTLDAMKPDCIVMRHSSSGAPDFVARNLSLPVINAGDGTHEHPTQALLDARTILDRCGHLEGLKVAIIGDIAHSRVARSNVHLLSKFGAEVLFCGPPDLVRGDEAKVVVKRIQTRPGVQGARDVTTTELDDTDIWDDEPAARLAAERYDAVVCPGFDDPDDEPNGGVEHHRRHAGRLHMFCKFVVKRR